MRDRQIDLNLKFDSLSLEVLNFLSRWYRCRFLALALGELRSLSELILLLSGDGFLELFLEFSPCDYDRLLLIGDGTVCVIAGSGVSPPFGSKFVLAMYILDSRV